MMPSLVILGEAGEVAEEAYPVVVEAADFHVVARPQAAVFRPARDEPAH